MATPITFVLGVFFLLLLTVINQVRLGVGIPQAIWNAKRNTLWSLFWSVACGYVWILALEKPSSPDQIISKIALTFVFTGIILAATKGAFQIGKGE